MKNIRCRFAPSPTGFLHLGGARTALFNYLFAKKNSGTFILRIEDTDLERSTDEATEAILAGLSWLGISYEEGPFFQSQRGELYQKYAQKLLASGHAYACYATQEELEEMRKEQQAQGKKTKYDGRFRPKEITPQATQLPNGKDSRPFVIRFRCPEDGNTIFNDLVLGEISTANEELEDFVIIRSSGAPTYNFVVVVDDIEMQISHIIRGNDHVSNTPKQVALYSAFSQATPIFAHVPMILGPDKQKLSKRHGATSVVEYKKDGYLPEAMLNYLARLGWSHGDQEIFSLDELCTFFDLKNIGKSPSVFDFQKLRWVNQEHMKKLATQELLPHLKFFLPDYQFSPNDQGLIKLIDNLKARTHTLKEMAEACIWYLTPEAAFNVNKEELQKISNETTFAAIKALTDRFNLISDFNEQTTENEFKNILQQFNLKMPQLAQPVRLALIGSLASLSVNVIFAILGKERVIKRLSQITQLI